MHEFEEKKLPNATVVLILGIFSILSCCCYGLPGVIMSIVGIILYNKDKKLYNESPGIYTNYNSLHTGFILSIIGIVLNILSLIYIIAVIIMFGTGVFDDPEQLREFFEQAS